jgi:hypothetical protein
MSSIFNGASSYQFAFGQGLLFRKQSSKYVAASQIEEQLVACTLREKREDQCIAFMFLRRMAQSYLGEVVGRQEDRSNACGSNVAVLQLHDNVGYVVM